MVGVEGKPSNLLEITTQNNVDRPTASFYYELDVDYLLDK